MKRKSLKLTVRTLFVFKSGTDKSIDTDPTTTIYITTVTGVLRTKPQ